MAPAAPMTSPAEGPGNGGLPGLDDASSSAAACGSPPPDAPVTSEGPEPSSVIGAPPPKAKRAPRAPKPRARPPSKGATSARKTAQAVVARAKGRGAAPGAGKAKPKPGKAAPKVPTPLEMYLRRSRAALQVARPDLDPPQLDRRLRLQWASLAESERQPFKKASEGAMRRWRAQADQPGGAAPKPRAPAARKRAPKARPSVAPVPPAEDAGDANPVEDPQRWLYREDDPEEEQEGEGPPTAEPDGAEAAADPSGPADSASEGSADRGTTGAEGLAELEADAAGDGADP
eukprot:EG_transcript_21520